VSAGTLHVCAVPIGNLADASPRVRDVLAMVDVIACEDTRTTRQLIELLGIETRAKLIAHHAHNERASAAGIAAMLADGTNIALVSDAGSPAVSDPGIAAVVAAHEVGAPVVAVPGPSALVAALGVAGIAGEGFRFAGFAPRGEADLAALLAQSAAERVVMFDAPGRVLETVQRIARVDPQREIAVCAELTKRFERVTRGCAGEVAEVLAAGPDPRGEYVLVVGVAGATDAVVLDVPVQTLELARAMLAEGVRPRVAAKLATKFLSGRSRDVYDALVAERYSGDS
jgi:16S rRNA (cytidine1402-2'-O)-methyltransferase